MNTSTPITIGLATTIGDRSANADAGAAVSTPLGICAAVVDGIGSSADVCAAARLAADVAATVGSHRGAQAALMAAADTMPGYPGSPNAVAAVASVEPGGRIEIAYAGDAAVWTWASPGALRRWSNDQTAGAFVEHISDHAGLTEQDRDRFEDVISLLSDYILNGLAYATVSTIGWTPLRDTDPELIVLTSDGVHKVLNPDQLDALMTQHHTDPQALADAIVADAVRPGAQPGKRDNATAVVIRIPRTA